MNGLEIHKQSLVTIKRAFGSSELLISDERKLDAIIKNMDEPINVMIIGEFNAGKSTLINTLLRDDYLRIDDVPTTAAITKLTYGESLEIRLFFKDGSERECPIADFEQISAEIGLEGARIREKLSYIQISHPSEILKKITLIDTPGANSAFKKHTKATESFMDQADIAYWLFDLNQIGSSSELDLIKEINKYVHPIGIINRIDELDEDDILENIIENAYTRLNPDVTEYMGISALYAQEAIVANDEELLDESNWHVFIDSLERETTSERVKFRKMDRVYQDLEKTLLSVKTIVDEAKESFNETFKQLDGADNYKTVLQTEIHELNDVMAKWSALSRKGNYFDLKRGEWPLHFTQDEKLKEKWEEQLFYMDEVFGKDSIFDLEGSNLRLEERQLNEAVRQLKEDWKAYETSGVFGNEPILFTGRKKVLENEQLQLNEDIKDYEARLYDFNYRANGHIETKKKGVHELSTIAFEVYIRLESIAKQRMDQYNDKKYLEKANTILHKTKWLPEFLDKVKNEILPGFRTVFNSNSPLSDNEQINKHYSRSLSLFNDFLDESISIEAYNKLHQKIESGMKEKELSSPKKKKQRIHRHRKKKRLSFSWLKPVSIVASIILLLYVMNLYKEPIVETVSSIFTSDEYIEVVNTENTKIVTVITDGANIRQGPNLNDIIINAVPKGEKLFELGRTTDADGREWINIKLSTGEGGWVSGKIVE